MNRRKFLGMLGVAPLTAKFAPVLKGLFPVSAYRTYICGTDAILYSMAPSVEEAFEQIAASEAKAQAVTGYQYSYSFVNREGKICPASPIHRDATLGDVIV